jgi:hypothetical protein
VDEILPNNKLAQQFQNVQVRVGDYKQRAKDFYFRVVFYAVSCPECGGRLQMSGQSQCRCSCGRTLDPTVEFQKSPCCGAKLTRKTFHYACTKCHRSVPSRFIFDERVFDKAYFRQLMRESRERKKRKRDEIRRLLANSRSGTLSLMEEPDLESIPGLLEELDGFIETETPEIFQPDDGNIFNIEDYRDHILSLLGWSAVRFRKILPIDDDSRRDQVWRFITLIYMQNDREVEIDQLENDLRIQRRSYNEAHC